MPSIKDIADQINGKLDQITTNTSVTAQNTADNLVVSKNIEIGVQQVNNNLQKIDQTLQIGFSNLSQGINNLLQVQIAALNLLDHHRKQNDIIICELQNNNIMICDIKQKLGLQIHLDEAELRAIERMEGIAERVNAGSAADYDRHKEVQTKIEVCCPPEPVELESCPELCKTPRFKNITLEKTDWKPLPNPETQIR